MTSSNNSECDAEYAKAFPTLKYRDPKDAWDEAWSLQQMKINYLIAELKAAREQLKPFFEAKMKN